MTAGMTNEEMATELRRAGWIVTPPIDRKTCRHPRKSGNGMVSSDGSSSYSWYCPDCYDGGETICPPRSVRGPTGTNKLRSGECAIR